MTQTLRKAVTQIRRSVGDIVLVVYLMSFKRLIRNIVCFAQKTARGYFYLSENVYFYILVT